MADKTNICIVTLPLGKSGAVPFSQIVKISEELSDELFIISGGQAGEIFKENGKSNYLEISHKKRQNPLMRALAYIKIQFSISFLIFQVRKKIDTVIFFIGGEGLILPSITSKLFNKELYIVLAGDPAKQGQLKSDPLKRMTRLLSNLVLRLSDKIVIYSPSIMNQRNLNSFSRKVLVAHRHVIDFDKFHIKEDFQKRENLIGYIGSLNELKGVRNLMKGINLFLEEDKDSDFKFIFIGDGPLENEINSWIEDNHLQEKVTLQGWVEHDLLPGYLNQLKLLILPSLSEGLPNIVLEAMACGTPVLTTPVGAIPDIITDEENGFILTDIKPGTIAQSLKRSIEHGKLDKIADNGFQFAREKFNFQQVTRDWQKILLNK